MVQTKYPRSVTSTVTGQPGARGRRSRPQPRPRRRSSAAPEPSLSATPPDSSRLREPAERLSGRRQRRRHRPAPPRPRRSPQPPSATPTPNHQQKRSPADAGRRPYPEEADQEAGQTGRGEPGPLSAPPPTRGGARGAAPLPPAEGAGRRRPTTRAARPRPHPGSALQHRESS